MIATQRSSIADALRLAVLCSSSASATCAPTRCSGLSALIGSWNTIEMRSPRSLRICAASSFVRSVPSSSTRLLLSIDTRGGSRPRIACAVIDLPEPDSPTRQTISFSAMSSDSRSTA